MNIEMFGKLADAFGPSGYETEVLQSAKPYLNGLQYHNDAMNNLYLNLPEADEKAYAGRPTILLDAHLDECGAMVQSIADDGSLRIILLGGVHPTSLPAHSVLIRTRHKGLVRGIQAAEPVHFMTEEQRKSSNVRVEEIKLDVGATSREETMESFGIHIGDPIVPDVQFSYDREHDLCYGKAFDNRAGCAVVISLMQKILAEKPDLAVRPVGALAAQEEVGERGATVTAQQVRPDLAIVFEGSPSDDFYFGIQQAQCRMGEGVQIRIMDKSYLSNAEFISFAEQMGDQYHVKYQEAVRRGGGTNASVISLTDHAVPVLVLGVPCRYVHSHYNFCKGADLDSAVDLAYHVICGLTQKDIAHILHQDVM